MVPDNSPALSEMPDIVLLGLLKITSKLLDQQQTATKFDLPNRETSSTQEDRTSRVKTSSVGVTKIVQKCQIISSLEKTGRQKAEYKKENKQ